VTVVIALAGIAVRGLNVGVEFTGVFLAALLTVIGSECDDRGRGRALCVFENYHAGSPTALAGSTASAPYSIRSVTAVLAFGRASSIRTVPVPVRNAGRRARPGYVTFVHIHSAGRPASVHPVSALECPI
jgi:hypothetical protein